MRLGNIKEISKWQASYGKVKRQNNSKKMYRAYQKISVLGFWAVIKEIWVLKVIVLDYDISLGFNKFWWNFFEPEVSQKEEDTFSKFYKNSPNTCHLHKYIYFE